MRRVEILVTCDPCLAWKGQEVSEGVETVPLVDGHTLDLCPLHRDGLREVIALIAEFADGNVRAVKALPPSLSGKARAAALAEIREAEASVTPGKRNRRGGKRARARREGAAVVAEAVEIAVEAAEERRPLTCPLCGRESPSSDALATHLGNVHSTTVGEFYGLTCPLCEHAEFASSRALGSHGKRAHGVVGGVVALFDRARVEGDPLGVLAARATSIAEAASE